MICKKIPLGNTDILWFTDGWESDNIGTPFDSSQGSTFTTSTQQTELYTLTWACTLAKGKTVNIYTDSRYAFRAAQDFGML